MTDFRALVCRELEPGRFACAVERRALAELPPGEVLIDVSYSSLNYKDMLSATGHRGITRHYPHTPGIDAAGVVIASDSSAIPVGAAVAILGYDLGMNTPGGLAERVRVPARWVLTRPAGFSACDAMRYGTAGLTAELCVDALRQSGVAPEHGEVVVTGASGGVGAIATAMLARHGYSVVAVSRKPRARDFLLAIGATSVLTPDEISTSAGKPLAKERWAGAIDTVGGGLLFELVKATRYGGAVTACGMAGGVAFEGNVYPFILRGVRLIGVDSVELDRDRKQAALDRLAGEDAIDAIADIATEIPLGAVPEALAELAGGSMLGRRVVRIAEA